MQRNYLNRESSERPGNKEQEWESFIPDCHLPTASLSLGPCIQPAQAPSEQQAAPPSAFHFPGINFLWEVPKQTQFSSFSIGTCLTWEHGCLAEYFAPWTTVPVDSDQHISSQMKFPLNLLKPVALTRQIFSGADISSHIFTSFAAILIQCIHARTKRV